MKRAAWFIFGFAILLAGCASVFDFRREEVFEDSAKRYGRMMRWSDFESARSFLAPSEPGVKTTPPKHVRIADYEVKEMAYAEGKRRVLQIVEISYFLANDPRIKTLQDHQVWEFDSGREAWLLKSGFPHF